MIFVLCVLLYLRGSRDVCDGTTVSKALQYQQEARTLAKYFIMITAFFMPQNAFLHATYFTLRSGGKTIVTFLFDSVFIWVVSVTIAFTLSRFTGLPVLVDLRNVVQAMDMMKCHWIYPCKKGVWLQNIVSGNF